MLQDLAAAGEVVEDVQVTQAGEVEDLTADFFVMEVAFEEVGK